VQRIGGSFRTGSRDSLLYDFKRMMTMSEYTTPKPNASDIPGIYDSPLGENLPRKRKTKSGKIEEISDEKKIKEYHFVGLVMIALGLLFLLPRLGILPDAFNWWALIIFLPGLAMSLTGLTHQLEHGELPEKMRGQAFGGLMLTVLGSIFLFRLDFGTFWPLFIIVPGIGIFLGWMGDKDEKDQKKDEDSSPQSETVDAG
jgi:hypothetical protein